MLAARMLRALLGFCFCLLVQLMPVLAQGQGQQADRALANDLFQRGRKALLEQKYAEACPLLEESQRLDPAGGTLLNLALCHENLGLTATAWTEFHDALAIARHERRTDRSEFALSHIAALESRLSRLVIEPEAPVAEGMVIERDGTVLGSSVWGKSMPVDPGLHTIRARAPGHDPFEQSVSVGESGDTQTVKVPALVATVLPPLPEPTPQVEPPVPIVEPPPPVVALPVEPPAPIPASQPTRRHAAWKAPLAWSLFALSLASAVTATVTGVRALQLRKDADSECDETGCSDKGLELDEQKRRNAHASTALTALSILAAGGGLVVWFVPGNSGSVREQPRAAHAQDTIAPVAKMRSVGLSFVGAF